MQWFLTRVIESKYIPVGVLEQLFDGQILMKFLYTPQEQWKGWVFLPYGFSNQLLHDYFQECSLKALWRSVLYIIESKHEVLGKIVLLACTVWK